MEDATFLPGAQRAERRKMRATVCLLSVCVAWASVTGMVRLKSRTQCAVNGFQFVDAPISPEPMQEWDFETLAQKVAARRAANPRFKLSTDMNTIRQEVDNQNALRMLSIRGADSYVVVEGGPAPNRAALHGWRNAVGGVKRVAAGAGTLKDWLGAGGVPVDRPLAEGRAAGCAVCPKNVAGDLTSWFTQPVAERIKAQVAMKLDLNLTTAVDEKLGICEACACPLKLKPWVPLPHIREHLSDEVKARLDPGCWILKELA